jgi:CheY-like chemotaxis protein
MQSNMKKADENRPVVLFADDDEICLDVGVRMLEKLGCKVLEAKDGYEAVEIFERNREKVDLVILDMRMPNNGGTAFGQIKKIDANAKIMIASGYCEESRIRNLLKQGCQGFIQKPYTLDHLSKKVNTILEN